MQARKTVRVKRLTPFNICFVTTVQTVSEQRVSDGGKMNPDRFKKADEIAGKIGIEKDNPLRVQSDPIDLSEIPF